MSSSSSLGGVFSFDTPEAVMHILASVRTSDLSPSIKNNLRDLILSYTNGGKDPSLKIQIEQMLSSHAIAPLPIQPSVADSMEFGSSRGIPTFKPSTVAAKPTPTPAPVAQQSAPVQPQPVVPAPAATPAPADLPAAAPAPTPQPAVPVAAAPPASTPATSAATPVVDTGALARIREIKALVNEQVGNPVNLVDIDNEVGREYMASLLDAMKKLNSGSGSAPAMQRLEAAYVAVESVMKAHAAASVSAPAPLPATPAATPPQPATPVPTPAAPVVAPAAEKSAPKTEPQVLTPVEVPQKNTTTATPEQDSRWSSPASAPAAPAAKPVVAAVPIIKSLSESQAPLKSVADVPAADTPKTVGGDDLSTVEVENGLQQLLSDWILFKKSGLFGTGPSGMQHPLYIKIKDLQIPLLLAGRFEGATQEIKQSITDYMNGWRYEQGIVYEQGETFDHYLRRVIRHILDLQK